MVRAQTIQMTRVMAVAGADRCSMTSSPPAPAGTAKACRQAPSGGAAALRGARGEG